MTPSNPITIKIAFDDLEYDTQLRLLDDLEKKYFPKGIPFEDERIQDAMREWAKETIGIITIKTTSDLDVSEVSRIPL